MRVEGIILNNTLWGRAKNCIKTLSFEMKKILGR
jgi:hypothetical protein